MSDRRNRQQIIDECAYAVACCIDHYCDAGLSREGVDAVKSALNTALPGPIESGTAFRESVCNRPYPEFSHRIIWPAGWWVTERNPE